MLLGRKERNCIWQLLGVFESSVCGERRVSAAVQIINVQEDLWYLVSKEFFKNAS